MYSVILTLRSSPKKIFLGNFTEGFFAPKVEGMLERLSKEINCGIKLTYRITGDSTKHNTVVEIYNVCWEVVGQINWIYSPVDQLTEVEIL